MARNRIFELGKYLALTCSHPTTPLSGQPVRIGGITAVATTDERSDGKTSVDLGPAVYDLKVKGVDDAGNVAVAAGDPLYYVDADINDGTGFLSKKSSGYFFGFALEAVDSGATDAAVRVLVVQGPGAGSSDIGAGTIAAADIATGAVTGVKIAAGAIKTAVIAGGAAGDLTVTGIAVGDELVAVIRLNRDATAANIDLSSITAEFTVSGADTINNAAGTNTTGDALLVIYVDKT